LEVDVGGAVLGRLEENRVDEPDERRIGDAVVGLEIGLLLLGRLELRLLLVDGRTCAEGLARADETADRGENVLARCNTKIDRVARREPKLVDAVQVRGIGDGNVQYVAAERV